MLKYAIILIAGYLLGSISVAVLFTRSRFGSDVRKQGSGNAGATNVARVFGMNAGLVTLAGDMCKTALPGLIGYLLAGHSGLALGCLGCLIGHCWPVFFDLKGGKGVSVSACIALLLDWRLFLIVVAWFFLMFLICRRVSLCSITAGLLFPLVYYLFRHSLDAGFVLCCMVPIIVCWQHRGNIARLVKGTEPPFKPKDKS